MQRCTSEGIAITVEYNSEHHVSAVRIVPEEESRSTDNTVMDRQVVSGLIDFLLPETNLRRSVDELDCSVGHWDVATGIQSGICAVTKTENGVTLHRQHVDRGAEKQDLLVTVAATSGLPLTSVDVESRFGPPVAERFVAAPSIRMVATYDDRRTATEILIEPFDQSQFIAALEGEQIVDELVPVWTRMGAPRVTSIFSGCNEVRIEEFENVTITRSYHHCKMPAEDLMTQAIIGWMLRRPLPKAVEQ